MILPLRLIGGNPFFNYDPRFLNATDVPFVFFAITCLFIAYFKTKNKKYNFNKEEVNIHSKEKFSFQSYDVLMQPKTHYENLTSTLKKSKSIPYKNIIIGFLICLFYYFLFTGRL